LIEETLRSGEHWNTGLDCYPGWFTTAYFHQPAELAGEVAESGLSLEDLIDIEGPGDTWATGRMTRISARSSSARPSWSKRKRA